MAIPDSPLTRSEEYLNNIATGEGAIPDVPLTRIEQYLDYIAKNGGSGGGGSGGGVMIVNLELMQDGDDRAYVCDKTAGEMMQAAESKIIVLRLNDPIAPAYAPIISATKTSRYRFETFFLGNQNKVFTANAESDYPYYVISK